MRAELAAFGGVEPALEQRAKNRWFNGAPVELGDVNQVFNIVAFQRHGDVVIKQSSVKPLNKMLAKFAVPLGHGFE